MKKRLCTLLCAAMMLSLSGCFSPIGLARDITNEVVSNITADITADISHFERADTSRKEIRVFSAGTGSNLRTVTDNGIIAEYVLNATDIFIQESMRSQMRGQKSSSIPSDADACYVFETWEEDVRSRLAPEDRTFNHIFDMALYQNDGKYYLSVQLFGIMSDALEGFFKDGHFDAEISDETGEYLIGLAEGDFHSGDPDGNGAKAPHEDSADFAQSYLQGRSDADYEGVAAVSKNQKIEILAAQGSEPVFSITGLQEIADFLNQQDAGEWEYTGSIPAGAEKICDIIRYAQPRKTGGSKLEEQYRDILYQASSGYYIQVVVADDGLDPAYEWLEPLCFKIPDGVAGYLKSLCG